MARVVFNGWDWGKSDVQEQVSLILKNLNEAMAEEQAKVNVENRTEEEKVNLLIRRGFTFMLQFLFLLVCWFGIGVVLYYEDEFYNLLSSFSPFLASWLPMIFIALVNVLIKPIIILIINMEGWDF